jgi:hypothetical protein
MSNKQGVEDPVPWTLKFLDLAGEAVTLRGVTVPRWFDVMLHRETWPTEVVVSVSVDPVSGPSLTGIRAGRGSSLSPRDAEQLLKDWLSTSDLLQFLTAQAGGSLAVTRLLENAPDEVRRLGAGVLRDAKDRYVEVATPYVRPQRRRMVTEEFLRDVAEVYRSAVQAGDAPTQAVSSRFTTTHSTAARWVREARKAGILGPSQGTRAGEATTPSE